MEFGRPARGSRTSMGHSTHLTAGRARRETAPRDVLDFTDRGTCSTRSGAAARKASVRLRRGLEFAEQVDEGFRAAGARFVGARAGGFGLFRVLEAALFVVLALRRAFPLPRRLAPGELGRRGVLRPFRFQLLSLCLCDVWVSSEAHDLALLP